VTACSGNGIGEKGMIFAAKIMAKFGLDLIEQPEILKKAKDEFDKATGGAAYKCPMPEGLPVPE
jgi:aminobenzoyl-glutamate utilization protein B